MNDHDFRSARRLLIDDLRRFLVGPSGGPEEILDAGQLKTDGVTTRRFINQTPYDFYHTGFLSPPTTQVNPAEDEQDEQSSDSEQSAGESVLVLANAAQQAAMGLTCQVSDPTIPIRVRVSWATYELEELPVKEDDKESVANSEEEEDPPKPAAVDTDTAANSDDAAQARRKSKWQSIARLGWRRIPEEFVLVFVPVDLRETGGSISFAAGKHIDLRVRRRKGANVEFLTITAVHTGGDSDPRLFQVCISLSSSNGAAVFVGSPNTARRRDNDFWIQELQYRKVQQYAVGHGVAVLWDSTACDGVSEIWTEWIPECEVFKASPSVDGYDSELALDEFADSRDWPVALAKLSMLASCYEDWIVGEEKELQRVLELADGLRRQKFKDAGKQLLDDCRCQLKRIKAGVQYLETNANARVAFQLANLAMARSMRISRPDRTPTWFPFQMAFMLVSLPSLSNGNHEERNTFDLIWFPTGGGKTEAYLGLSAYTLFYRALAAANPSRSAGTSIITRYTLRTLTIQQFERTARAIMACEVVRRESPELEKHPHFSIGLLVGSGATPKWVTCRKEGDGSAADLHRRGGQEAAQGLLPLKNCPWCNTSLTLENVTVIENEGRVITKCGNSDCSFHGGLPVVFVDEHLTVDPPSFVVSTIDKFAQIAWEPSLATLLGQGRDVFPPDLIIQDELHLITDSLGTIAGAYETVIDALATRDGVAPKIIGATATIRRAPNQVKSLFLRETRQFPPSGLSEDDSFFYSRDKTVPGRQYIGIHAQGRSPKHTLPRILGTLAQGTSGLPEGLPKDDFWTLVTYFNSLRELGGALVIAEDDVPAYQRVIANVTKSPVRYLRQKIEMTSQVPSYRIPEILLQLQRGPANPDPDADPIDLLFATNMISVGVDVDRLGLMIIVGQPKTTAEYIQASSRVGRPRGHAGLVVTQYNWTRPRDRSHYERFLPYHLGFYRFVEAASVTPFAPRARDKALPGVVAALIRSTITSLAANHIQNHLEIADRIDELLEPVARILKQRVNQVDPDEAADSAIEIDELLKEFGDFLKRPGNHKFWIPWRVPSSLRERGDIMLDSGLGRNDQDATWTAMLSMRDTDQPALIVIKDD